VARFNVAVRNPGFPGGRLPMSLLKAAPLAIAVGALVFLEPVTPAGYVGYVTEGAVWWATPSRSGSSS